MPDNRFKETYISMRDAVGYTEPISYGEWLRLREDYKAAWLYVQFYSQIALAWRKVSLNNQFADPDNGVSEMLRYCVKNVDIIKSDPPRFTKEYMYQVAYNCLYCIAIDRVSYKMTYELFLSQYIHSSDGTDINIFESMVSETGEDPLNDMYKREIWELITKSIDETPAVRVIHKHDGTTCCQNPRAELIRAYERAMSTGFLSSPLRKKLKTIFEDYKDLASYIQKQPVKGVKSV